MIGFFRKLTWLPRRARKERELQDELQFHLDEETEHRIADGLRLDDARRAARRDLGNLTIVREDVRAAWGWTLLEQLGQDLGYGWRMLVANRTFSALAILSLALGIGANTAIFSFMDAMLLRALPVSDSQSLVTLAWKTRNREMSGSNRHDVSYTDPGGGFVGGAFAYQSFELLQRDTRVFTTLFGYQGAGALHVAVDGHAEIAMAEYVSGNYFAGLAVSPESGRLISPEDDRAGAPAVAVIAHALSERRFGGPARAAGASILIDNIPFTVIGVTPREFFGADPDARPEVYVPLHANLLLQAGDKYAQAAERYANPNFHWIIPMARLRPGVTAAQAQAALSPVYSAWKAATDPKRATADPPALVVKPSAIGLDGVARRYSKPLYLLLGVVGLILAIACANIANLLMARASSRKREMAIRLSMGAGRPRVVRQLLTESLLLSGMGGALGIVFAVWGIRFLTALLLSGRGDQPFAFNVGLNWRVLGAAGALSLMTGLLFGLTPALQATRVDVVSALKGVKNRASYRMRWLSPTRVLVILQMCVTLLILIAAGLFLRTLSNLESIPLGFDRERVLTFRLNARQAGYDDRQIERLYSRLRAEFRAVPGVRTVTLSDSPLLGTGWSATGVSIAGSPPTTSSVLTVGPDFFSTMQIPLLRGRAVVEGDQPGTPYVAVVNEEFVSALLQGGDPIGTHVTLPRACAKCDVEIVGVVQDARYGRLKEAPPPTIFLALSQALWGPVGEVTYQLRTAGNALALVRRVSEIIERADPRVPPTNMKTQRALIEGMINQEVLFARLCAIFAFLALAIACVGLYATMSYGVARRTSEIGVRMALGARRATVIWMVLREVLALGLAGFAISLPVALATSKIAESFLYDVRPNDPLTVSAAVVTLGAAMLLAGYLPARAASRIEPIVALRHE